MSENAAHSTHISFGKYIEDIYLKPCTLNTQSPDKNKMDTMSQKAAHSTHKIESQNFEHWCINNH